MNRPCSWIQYIIEGRSPHNQGPIVLLCPLCDDSLSETRTKVVDRRVAGVTATYTGESGLNFLAMVDQQVTAFAAPQSQQLKCIHHSPNPLPQGEGGYCKVITRATITKGSIKGGRPRGGGGGVIHSDDSNIVMNSKLDYHLPAVSRAVFSSPTRRGVRERIPRKRSEIPYICFC